MLSLKSETDLLREFSDGVRQRRLLFDWRQADLAARSGVAIATLRRFERTGQIGFHGLAKLLVSLGLADALISALKPPAPAPRSMKAFMAGNDAPKRQRARLRTIKN